MPDLAGIAATSGLSLRKLRYVFDHHLLPGGEVASRGRGAARTFTSFEAFGLVVAAMMLEAGVKRALVRDCLVALCPTPSVEINAVPLYRAFAASGSARLEVGDWRYVRLIVSNVRSRPPFATPWLPLGRGEPPAVTYAPLIMIAVDVGQIRSKVNARM